MSTLRLDDHIDDDLRAFARQYAANGSRPRTCAEHGHVERPGPWGPCCRYCGTPLPEPKRTEGRWVALSKGRVWVPR